MTSREQNHPNVLFILTDDQGPWAMGCAGNPEIRTPNLDRIARTGIRFENFFCVSPVCSPARASILTGRIPSQHGVHDWIRAGSSTVEQFGGKRIEYLRGQPGYTDILAANGYLCGISGKWHMGDSHMPQKGFSYWEVHARGGGPYYQAPMIREGEVYKEDQYVIDAITDNAMTFLDRCEKDEKPFYLSVHYTAPHSPWDRDDHPADLWDDYYENCAFDSIPWVATHPWQANALPPTDREDRRRMLSGYFAAVTAMDAGVGRLLDWLEQHGMRENTLVVFTSDNGMNMGHHGVYGKGNGTFPQNMYDTSVKVPALVSRPGHIAEGDLCEALLSHYDMMPTLLDYLGMGNPSEDRLPGRSFAPLLRGESFEQRQDVVVFDEYGPVRMIRDREWKYVHRHPYGPHELYHLPEDPNEDHNLFANPAYDKQVIDLRGRLYDWFALYVDPLLDGSKEPVTGKGQIRLAGPAGKGEDAFAGEIRYTSTGANRPPQLMPGDGETANLDPKSRRLLNRDQS